MSGARSISQMQKCRLGITRMDLSHGSDPAVPGHKTGILFFASDSLNVS